MQSDFIDKYAKFANAFVTLKNPTTLITKLSLPVNYLQHIKPQ